VNVVVVDAGLPVATRSAGERAVVDQLDALAALDHRVTVVALGRDPGCDPGTDGTVDDLTGRGVTVHPSVGPDALRAVLGTSAVDVVVVHRPGPALAVGPVLAEHPTVPVVYMGHDLHADRIGDETALLGGDPRRARLAAVAERAAWARADVVTYPTAAEATAVRERTGREHAVAVPYYRLTAPDLARPTPPHAGSGLLLVGGAAHAPNRDAVREAVTTLLPRLRAQGVDDPLTVVGEWPAAARTGLDDGVRFTGRVSDAELRALHHDHRVLLAPLRFGAGAKRKIVAAMGLGLPVVTTSVGACGALVRDATTDDGVSVADDPDAIAHAVATLADPAVARSNADRAHAAVTAAYGTGPYDRALAAVLIAAVGDDGSGNRGGPARSATRAAQPGRHQ